MMSARTCLPSWRVRPAGGRRGWRRCIARRAAPGFTMMWPVLAVLAAVWPLVAGCQEAEPLTLQVGETRVLAAPGVARVAVGDGSVVNAAAADGREVLVFGRAAGSTSLHIWQAGGKRRGYAVQVEPAGMRRIRDELATLLERIPDARSLIVGERIVIEGENLSDADQRRIAALAERYPEVIDFTSRIGWDRMVLLDVQVVELPRSALREWGVRWDGASQGGVAAGLAWERAGSGLSARPGEVPVDARFPAAGAAGYFGINALLSARLDALAQNGDAVVLAQPQLLARSGATANFLAGGEVPYATVDANGNSTTIFKPYGVSLKITPHVERNGTVRSRIEVEVSAVDTTVNAPGGPALSVRRAATEFNMLPGQTLVLGGFLSREQSTDLQRLPGLGDIPILGALFGSRRFQQRETELAIFVTPVLAGPDHPDLAERVARGRQVLDQAFSEPVRLNRPVRAIDARTPWDPYSGPASQWSQGAAGNVYDFGD